MLTFLIGMMGGLLIVVIFVLGALFGKYLLNKPQTKEGDREFTEEEKQERLELQRAQEAFLTQMTYNADMAYGLKK